MFKSLLLIIARICKESNNKLFYSTSLFVKHSGIYYKINNSDYCASYKMMAYFHFCVCVTINFKNYNYNVTSYLIKE